MATTEHKAVPDQDDEAALLQARAPRSQEKDQEVWDQAGAGPCLQEGRLVILVRYRFVLVRRHVPHPSSRRKIIRTIPCGAVHGDRPIWQES